MSAPGPVRARFAPSPTGALHLGSARTAVLNWLFARSRGGAFVLRVEDTDEARAAPDGERLIYEGLEWLGLAPDEGPREGGPFGPYRQSERRARHRELAEALLEAGAAFPCDCGPEEARARREAAIASGTPVGRDERCRARADAGGLPPGGAGGAAIRLRVASGPIAFEDRLKGSLAVDGDDVGDFVLLRADGRPTYNFAVAADDLDMRITHVIRGVEHLSNTPKQALAYRALGAAPPQFVHIPTVLAPDGGKLSKRRGAPGLAEYEARGFHPAAVVNYLSLLSWSAADGEEFLPPDELVRRIDLDRLGAVDPRVDEEKLAWLSGRHIRAEPAERLARLWSARPEVAALGLSGDDLRRAAEVFAGRARLLADAAGELGPVFGDPAARSSESEAGAAIRAAGGDATAAVRAATSAWEAVPWRPEALAGALSEARRSTGLAGRDFFPHVRRALTGLARGPALGDIAYALGRERVLARLRGTRGGR